MATVIPELNNTKECLSVYVILSIKIVVALWIKKKKKEDCGSSVSELDDNFSLQPKLSSHFPITTLILGKHVGVTASVWWYYYLSSCLVHDTQEQEKKGINSKGKYWKWRWQKKCCF